MGHQPVARGHHRNQRNYVASSLRFPHSEKYLRKLSANRTRALKKLASPALGRRSLNIIGFIGRQIVSLPIAPNYSSARGAHMSRAGPVTTTCYIRTKKNLYK